MQYTDSTFLLLYMLLKLKSFFLSITWLKIYNLFTKLVWDVCLIFVLITVNAQVLVTLKIRGVTYTRNQKFIIKKKVYLQDLHIYDDMLTTEEMNELYAAESEDDESNSVEFEDDESDRETIICIFGFLTVKLANT